MAAYTTAITHEGRVTIPDEFRRALALEEGDEVTVTLENGHVRLDPVVDVVDRTAGMLKYDGPPRSIEEEKEAFGRAVAEDVMASMER